MEEYKTLEPPSNLPVWRRVIVPWFVCLVSAILYAYDFFLRIAPSVMISPLMHSLHVYATTIGFISAFYYYGYTPLQVPSGILIDRFNVQLILFISALLCVVGAFLFALVPYLPILLLARFLMGVGSAFAFVGSLKLASRWIAKKNYALFIGVATTLGTLGAVVADCFLSRWVSLYGWQQASLITAYIGIAIAILILLFVRDKPPWLIKSNIPKIKWNVALLQFWTILKTPGFWYNGIVGCILFIPINVIASLWGVAFLTHAKHVAPTKAAMLTSLIFIGTATGSPIAGFFSDYIKRRRLPLYVGTVCILVVTIFLVYLPITSLVIIYLLLFLLGFFTGAQILVFAIVKDISPPNTTGISSASTNFIITIGAAVFQPLIGYLLDTSWKGDIGTHGMHLYSTHDFKVAFSIIPILMAISLILIKLIPKTISQQSD